MTHTVSCHITLGNIFLPVLCEGWQIPSRIPNSDPSQNTIISKKKLYPFHFLAIAITIAPFSLLLPYLYHYSSLYRYCSLLSIAICPFSLSLLHPFLYSYRSHFSIPIAPISLSLSLPFLYCFCLLIAIAPFSISL